MTPHYMSQGTEWLENASLAGGQDRLEDPCRWISHIFLGTMCQQEAPPVKEEAFTSTHKPITVGGQSQVAVGTTHISRLTDDQLIREFLSGSYCLHGVRPDEPSSSSSIGAQFPPLASPQMLLRCRESAGGNTSSAMGNTFISITR